MKKYRVIKPWYGVQKGQILEIKDLSPMFTANVVDISDEVNSSINKKLVNDTQADEVINKATEAANILIENGKAEAEKIVSDAKSAAEKIINNATAEAEKVAANANKAGPKK